jgi:hypothetical protein
MHIEPDDIGARSCDVSLLGPQPGTQHISGSTVDHAREKGTTR